MTIVLSLLLIGLGWAILVVRNTYSLVPLIELKRRARHNDKNASAIYRAAAYGRSLDLALYLLSSLALGGSLILLREPLGSAPLLVLSSLILTISLLINTFQTTNAWTAWLGATFAHPIAWLLSKIHRPLNIVSRSFRHPSNHTGLYQKEDMMTLVSNQRHQPGNRFSEDDLAAIERILKFSEKTVGDIALPLSSQKTLKSRDMLGAVLLDELHKSSQTTFPVVEKKQVVGGLTLDAALKCAGKRVQEVMDTELATLQSAQSIDSALRLLATTGQRLFPVIDDIGKTLGVVSAQTLINQLLRPVE